MSTYLSAPFLAYLAWVLVAILVCAFAAWRIGR
jgi:hypothetical protein